MKKSKKSLHHHQLNRRTKKTASKRSRTRRSHGKGRPFGVSLKNMRLFYESMGKVIRSGQSLLLALNTFGSHKVFGASVARIVQAIEKGSALSESMAKEPQIFVERDIAQIYQGEATGSLDQSFLKLADRLGQQSQYRTGLLKSLLPTFGYIVAALIALRIPQVITGKMTLGAFLTPIFVVLAVVFLAIFLCSYTQPFRWMGPKNLGAATHFLSRLPVLRQALMAQTRVNVADGMYLIFSSGLSLNVGIPLCLRTIPVPNWRQAMSDPFEKLLGGSSVSECFTELGIFGQNDMVRINTGELSGSLDQSFAAIAADARANLAIKMRVVSRTISITASVVVMIFIGSQLLESMMKMFDELGGLAGF